MLRESHSGGKTQIPTVDLAPNPPRDESRPHMNKAQLVDAVTDRLGGRQSAADAVDAVLDAIVRAVVGGDRVSITGFGSFEKVSRSARYARNPQTGERIRVKKDLSPPVPCGSGI
ncbi:hypothetical protein GCM10020000_85590 [Streptomyces olivoverticillatus]